MSELKASGPDAEAIARYITDTFPGVDVVSIPGGTFFSLDPEKHFPNFATIVTNDDFDDASNLSRPGLFRVNMGVTRATFERYVDSSIEPDYPAVDTVLPHPVYGRQLWLSIVSPSADTFETVIRPLLAGAYERLAAQRARHARRPEGDARSD